MERAAQGFSKRKGFRYWLPRILTRLLIVLVLPIPIGTGWQFFAQRAEDRQVLPLGQLTNVDGHFIHIYCPGQGSPVESNEVLLEDNPGAFRYWMSTDTTIQDLPLQGIQEITLDLKPGFGKFSIPSLEKNGQACTTCPFDSFLGLQFS